MANQHFTFASLQDLHEFYHDLPEGSTASGIASDLEAGNIDEFTVEKPDGTIIEVSYTGPVAEGYVSPFETQSNNQQEAEKLLKVYNEYEEKLFSGGKGYQDVQEHAWGDLEDQIEALGFSLNSPPQRLSTLKPLK